MSPFKIMVTSALCAVSFGAFAADRIEGINACSRIQWNAQFLKEHPRAPAGCQAVVTRDGVKFAKFSGRVRAVSGTQATVAMMNVAGTEGTTIMLDTSGGAMVTINGKDTKASDLKVGDTLNFYVREGQFGAAPTMTMSAPAVVTPKAMPSN